MSKFRVPRPLVGAMEAAAVCIRRCSNVLPPNMALVSLFNHDTISINLLLRLNILLALCYLAYEVPATSHEDLLTSLGTSLRAEGALKLPGRLLPLKRPTVSPEDQGCWGNLAVVSHQATIPTRTR